MMYKVIGPDRSRTTRVAWLLEELGEPYELIKEMPRSETVMSFNPSGKVPVLLEGDTAIIDSFAICTYLADKHGQLTYPAGTLERARQDSFTHFAADELDAILWMTTKNTFIHPEDIRVPQIKSACVYEWNNSMNTLEERLGDNKYVMGDMFTVPDLIIAHCAMWAKMAKFEWPQGSVTDYFKRVIKRPALARVNERYAEPV